LPRVIPLLALPQMPRHRILAEWGGRRAAWSRTLATRGEWQRLLRLCRRTVVEVDRNRSFSASRSRRSRTLFCRRIPCLTWCTPLRGSVCLLVPESGRDGCISRSHVRHAPRRERKM
ncbi:unnamed protein product, partial [Scytosiphon promiscuus]